MDSVLEILKSYKKTLQEEERLKNSQKFNLDEFRLKWDNDAKYYFEEKNYKQEEALKADVIISFWSIYKRLLLLNSGWNASKTVKALTSLIWQIEHGEKDIARKIRDVNSLVEPFAEICYSPSNYMVLPARMGMNNIRFQETEDRIDLTMLECFDGGKLSKYFVDITVPDWIEREKLFSLFNNKTYDKENIKWFIENKQKISLLSEKDLLKYIDESIAFITNRK